MRELLQAGANPHQEFEWHNCELRIFYIDQLKKTTTAALAACALGNKEMLELMFEFGVDTNAKYRGMSLLSFATCDYQDVSEGG
jgi:hypothetical protein